jgi:N,N-dimethylformamidase
VVPLIGYVDRFSARPGETVAVKVSSELGDPYRADFVRLIHGDANPAGPGLKFEEVPASFAGTYRSRSQPLHLGSCGLVLPNKTVPFSRSLHGRCAHPAVASRPSAADGAGS